jgi:hypothetical protein
MLIFMRYLRRTGKEAHRPFQAASVSRDSTALPCKIEDATMATILCQRGGSSWAFLRAPYAIDSPIKNVHWINCPHLACLGSMSRAALHSPSCQNREVRHEPEIGSGPLIKGTEARTRSHCGRRELIKPSLPYITTSKSSFYAKKSTWRTINQGKTS